MDSTKRLETRQQESGHSQLTSTNIPLFIQSINCEYSYPFAPATTTMEYST